MLKTDRIWTWILILALALLLPSTQLVKPVDELTVIALIALALTDSAVNSAWRRYSLLWVMTGIMALYAAYSLTAVSYNTPYAIAVDYLIQLKPYIAFAVFVAVGPRFTDADRRILCAIAVVNAITAAAISAFSNQTVQLLIMHISIVGITAVISFAVWLLCSIRPDGSISATDKAMAFMLLALGLPSGRAKFFGTCVVSLYFILVYMRIRRPIRPSRQLLTAIVVGGLVAAVGWNKFRFYFIDLGYDLRGGGGGIENLARPALYAAALLIMISRIPFGSGLASFASHASGEIHYSKVYYEYGLNHVYGLTPAQPDFICDAYYPSLAQLGLAGVALFIAFWIYVAAKLRRIRRTLAQGKALFAIAWIIILFMLIESIASTTLVQPPGVVSMMLLGIICSATPATYGSHTSGNQS